MCRRTNPQQNRTGNTPSRVAVVRVRKALNSGRAWPRGNKARDFLVCLTALCLMPLWLPGPRRATQRMGCEGGMCRWWPRPRDRASRHACGHGRMLTGVECIPPQSFRGG